MMKIFLLLLIFSWQAKAQFTATTNANKSYRAGLNIPVKLTFPTNVIVTGVPQLSLTVGSTQVNANYASGSGTSVLTFNYTVAPGDSDLDGIVLDSSINLNGGTLTSNGEDCLPTIVSQTLLNTVKIDTTPPTLLSVAAPPSKTYYLGQIITFTATFSEPMYPAGSPVIAVDIGGTTVNAVGTGFGTTTIAFNYTVTDSVEDLDGIDISSPIQLNGGLVRDLAGNASTLDFTIPDTAGVIVSGTSPVVTSVTGPADSTYGIGENLNFTLIFNRPVFVSNAPSIPLNLNGVIKQANYISGSGTDSLTFRYTTQAGFPAPMGVKVMGTYTMNGGSIKDASNNDVAPSFTAKVFPRVYVAAPAPGIISISLPSNPPAAGHSLGQPIDISVVFSEPVTASSQSSFIQLNVGGANKNAFLYSGSGTNTLVYRWVVTNGSLDLDGILIKTPINLNGSTIISSAGVPVLLTFTTPDTSSIKVDAVAATVSSNTFPANNTYAFGQNLDFNVVYSENVIVTDNPRIVLNIGGSLRFADYLSGSGTSTLTFRYSIESNVNAPAGLTLVSTIDSSLGSIKDEAGNNVVAPLVSLNAPGVIVFGQFPVILSVTPPENRTYGIGDNLDFTVNFSRSVNVTGTPKLSFAMNSIIKQADYLSGSGTSSLIFRYPVAAGFAAPNGIFLTGNFIMDSATVQDLSGNDALMAYTKKTIAGVIVDAPNPQIVSVSVSSTPPARYLVNDFVELTVVFSEPMFATANTSRIPINVGGVTQYAVNSSGSGTNTFIYRYKVQPFKEDQDGIDIVGPLQLMSTVLTTASGAKPNLTITPFSAPTIIIDGMVPTVIANSIPDAGNLSTGETLNLTVNYSRKVIVTGNPRIQLKIGPLMAPVLKYANYVSGSGTNQLTFSYTIAPGDSDDDGLGVNNLMNTDVGSIVDEVGNNATIWGAGVVLLSLNFSATKINSDSQILNVTAPVANTYVTGNELNFVVTYSKNVNVTGTPRIPLTVGSSTVYANYISGSGTDSLTFRYTVATGNIDSDGLEMSTPIELNGGLIQDDSQINAGLSFTAPGTSGILVNGLDLRITSITPPSNTTYTTGQNLNFSVAFSSTATVTGTPRLKLRIGATEVNANYISGSGSSTLLFRYAVVATENDSDGISTVGPSLELNGGTIRDSFAQNADVTFTGTDYSNVRVDTQAPVISSVTGPEDGTYGNGAALGFAVTFSENVAVTGTPRIMLTIGATTRYATYVSGSGSSTLNFNYTVAAGESDSNGITASSPLQLNSGTIRDAVNISISNLTFTSPNMSGVIITTTAPSISSFTAPSNATYKTGNNLNFNVTYTTEVFVTGNPRIALTVGSSTVYANYVSGSGTNVLTFRSTVAAGDSDANGIALTSPIQLNGGTIKDEYTTNAGVSFTLPNTTGILVDGIDLVITSMAPPAQGIYKSSHALNFIVNYNYPAIVTGTPRIQLTVGAATPFAVYVSGSGTSAHTYRYIVAGGHNDPDGITSVGPSIQPNGGAVRDAFGDDASLIFPAGTHSNVKVDTVAPTISSMVASANKTYIAGESITFTATYSEPVTITGTPRISLIVNTTTRYANYFSGSGTNTIVFKYDVLAGHVDTNGISMATSVSTNGGTITDLATNAQSTFTFSAPSTTGLLVDGVLPTIASVTAPTSATYGPGSNVDFRLNFSEAVTVTGTPQLSLTFTGGGTKIASYVSGSGTTGITFRYTVVTNDTATSVATVSPLNLNGGTLKDAAGNNAAITFTGTNYTGVLVDAAVPTISSVTVPANNTYKNGGTRPTMSFTVTFSENVTISGTPRLALTIGSTTRYASYLSGSGSANIVFRYTMATTDLDLDGIEFASLNVDTNGGTIRDAGLNSATLSFSNKDMTKVFAVPSTMRNWYDLSDTTKIVLNGSNVTRINDKITTLNLTHTLSGGVPYNANGFNGGNDAYVDCSNSGSFNTTSTTTASAIVAVFRAPTGASGEYLYFSTLASRPMVQFSSTANGGTVTSGVTGTQFSAGNWGTNASTTTNFWNSDQIHARAFSWSSTQNRVQSICDMNGELAEFFMFSSRPTAAQMLEIEAYINARYGLDFP